MILYIIYYYSLLSFIFPTSVSVSIPLSPLDYFAVPTPMARDPPTLRLRASEAQCCGSHECLSIDTGGQLHCPQELLAAAQKICSGPWTEDHRDHQEIAACEGSGQDGFIPLQQLIINASFNRCNQLHLLRDWWHVGTHLQQPSVQELEVLRDVHSAIALHETIRTCEH